MRQQIPHAAELIPAIFIQLNRGPVARSVLAASIKNDFLPHCVFAANDTAFRSRFQDALKYLLKLKVIESYFKKGPVYLTEIGYDFIRKLDVEAIVRIANALSRKVNGRESPLLPWSPDVAIMQAVRGRIERAKQGLPITHPLETQAAAMAARILSALPEMLLDKMYLIWTNACRDLSHSKEIVRLAAPMVINAIDRERSRRGPDATCRLPNGKFFRWPTTVGVKGDGALQFEADEFGVLAKGGYAGPRLVSATARRNGLSTSQLFTWRRLARDGRLAEADEMTTFASAIIGDNGASRGAPPPDALPYAIDEPGGRKPAYRRDQRKHGFSESGQTIADRSQ